MGILKTTLDFKMSWRRRVNKKIRNGNEKMENIGLRRLADRFSFHNLLLFFINIDRLSESGECIDDRVLKNSNFNLNFLIYVSK